jgi:hypothetical protein
MFGSSPDRLWARHAVSGIARGLQPSEDRTSGINIALHTTPIRQVSDFLSPVPSLRPKHSIQHIGMKSYYGARGQSYDGGGEPRKRLIPQGPCSNPQATLRGHACQNQPSKCNPTRSLLHRIVQRLLDCQQANGSVATKTTEVYKSRELPDPETQKCDS